MSDTGGKLDDCSLALLAASAMIIACTKTTPMVLTPEGAQVRVSDF